MVGAGGGNRIPKIMISKLRSTLRSPFAIIICVAVCLVALSSLSGLFTAARESGPTLEEFMRDTRKRYSQHDEELVIRHFFQDRREGVFLDVGCAWPIRNSTTFYLERHLDWSGIAVDALDVHAFAWSRNRPQSRFFNYAVSDQSGGTIKFYLGGGVSSMFKEHTVKRLQKEPDSIEVELITLNDLLERAGIDKIDFMSMDIEGAEPLALAGFDIERYAPEFVCIEGRWSENAPKILEYFEAHGYELMDEYNVYEKANYYFRKLQN